jgi:hypothetical protein
MRFSERRHHIVVAINAPGARVAELRPLMRLPNYILLSLLLVTGCGKQEPPRSLDAFRRIGASTSLEDVRREFGPPDHDVGSGLYIYVYRLDDGSEVRVGGSDSARVLYVRHGTNILFEKKP